MWLFVNTDVEVPEEWLERLMLRSLCHENIATTTRFTTCGTICSFPDFLPITNCLRNAVEIDDEFRMIRPQYPGYAYRAWASAHESESDPGGWPSG